MAKPVVFNWPNSSTLAITPLTFLPTHPTGTISIPGGYFSFGNVARIVTLTSPNNDYSGASFTITGTLFGQIVSQTINGPNNTTVATTQLFNEVSSVTYTGYEIASPLYLLSVGSGTTGYTNWFLSNYNQRIPLTSIQVNVTGTINYTYQSTLDDVTLTSTPMLTNGVRVPNLAAGAAAVMELSAQTADAFSYQQYPTLYSRILINSSTAGAGSLVATFLQQGIT